VRTRRLVVLAALVGMLAGGCAEPLTQLVLVVDTDIPLASPNPAIPVAPDQLREISLSLYGPCRDPTSCPPQFVDSAQQYNLPGSEAPPFSIGLLLENDDPGRFVFEGVARLGPEGSTAAVPVRIVTEFSPGETRVVTLHFFQACVDQTCPSGRSCGRGGSCVPNERAPGDLPVWTDELEDFATDAQ
jgi:hypothetical protein